MIKRLNSLPSALQHVDDTANILNHCFLIAELKILTIFLYSHPKFTRLDCSHGSIIELFECKQLRELRFLGFSNEKNDVHPA